VATAIYHAVTNFEASLGCKDAVLFFLAFSYTCFNKCDKKGFRNNVFDAGNKCYIFIVDWYGKYEFHKKLPISVMCAILVRPRPKRHEWR
jgi:hypothetical protein